MERQLEAPLLITPSRPKKLRTKDVYETLLHTNPSTPFGTAKTQIDRLIDALGVDCGAIPPSESDAREQKRKEERLAARAERRRIREEDLKAQEEEDLEGQIEGLEDEGTQGITGQEAEGDMENGGVEFEGEEGMEDRGDVEYGDVERDEDDDEPDHEDATMEVDE